MPSIAGARIKKWNVPFEKNILKLILAYISTSTHSIPSFADQLVSLRNKNSKGYLKTTYRKVPKPELKASKQKVHACFMSLYGHKG